MLCRQVPTRSTAGGRRGVAAISVTAFLMAAQLGAALRSEEPTRAVTEIHAYPPEVRLSSARDRQLLVLEAAYADGTTAEVTELAKWSVEAPAHVVLEGQKLRPVSDGGTQVRAEFGGKTILVPVEVKSAEVDRPVSFRLDVLPSLTKAGCNTGACHGASRGKDGFRLSLFGYDPDGDYFRLTRELYGRRINLALTHQSLVLRKATGQVSHTGGQLFKEDSELYHTIHRWLDRGAPPDPKDIARVTEIEVYPKHVVLSGAGASQQLVVRARYSDGTERDVTSLTYFLSNNDTSARASPEGVVTADRRGEAFVMARFDSFTVGTHVIVVPNDTKFVFPDVPAYNYIDELVHRKLRDLRIAPSGIASDEEFLRRATLDIAGVLPTVGEHREFIESTDPKKREKLVDDLLGRKEFVELWVLKWAELLQIRSSRNVSYKAMLLYYNWLQERLANNVPMDQMVRELLGTSGGTFGSPATNYYQGERDTLKVAENVAQVFMGMRIQCAQCHNHPFDRWTQDDYYGFAGFFSQIGRKQGEDPRENIIFDRRSGEVRHPVGGRVMRPKFLGGAEPELGGRDRRQVLAEWLASPDNPYFAKNLANIVWAHFFGRGIIDEVDDVRVSNPPSNKALLDELGRRFTEYKYDFRKLVRDICTSRTYQLSTATNSTNETDNRNFSHGAVRRIRAEILLDAISQVTETKNKFRGLPSGARAVQIADGSTSTYFLTTFGRAKRETVCSCEVQMEPTLSQALHLLNGDTVARKIREGRVVERSLAEKMAPEDIVADLYVRCLGRRPTEAELAKFREMLAAEKDPRPVLEDIFWALLNSREFLFNH